VKKEAPGSAEMIDPIYQTTRRLIPEYRNLHFSFRSHVPCSSVRSFVSPETSAENSKEQQLHRF
jgi:hypothetical protein